MYVVYIVRVHVVYKVDVLPVCFFKLLLKAAAAVGRKTQVSKYTASLQRCLLGCQGYITMDELWGDRSGVLHMARNQHWSFGDFNIYLPVNLMSYK